MAKKLEIRLITPNATEQDKYKFHGHGDMAILRCRTGEMGILPGRVAISAILDEGPLRILDENEERKIAVLGGVFHFKNDILTVISQKALLPGEIDITATEAQASELEARILQEPSVAEKDKLRQELRRCRILQTTVA